MKAVIQRVSRASVRVDGKVVGQVGRGMLILLGAMKGDGVPQAERLAERVARFRFFPDGEGRMNRSALDLLEDPDEGPVGVLLVSQFTLAADGRKGRRPSFDRALEPALAEPLVDHFKDHLRSLGLPVETGVFGASMAVELLNDGPVTFVLDEDS
ncbi:MAG: D-tyrosyl-tRNA(Tyr) deacylase [Planctomycetes bacterium]|nr:D-tyrosyl-tRNA(Tyr) deacylase [Planctomycetota bacterium]